MLEKSKIRQILLDQSLGQILKIDGTIESILPEEQIQPIQSFHQHFHTTAKRDYCSGVKHRNKSEKPIEEFWKCVRPRTPSISFNFRQRITIFDEQKNTQQQTLNYVLPWEPQKKHIPLNKQTKRKPWFTQTQLHESICDPPKQKTICFVNYSKTASVKERPQSQYHIDDRKATKTYILLKPNYQRRNMDFGRLVDRNNASPQINKF